MAKKRMTKDIVESVSKLASEDAAEKSLLALKEQRHQAAIAVFIECIGRSLYDTLQSLPTSFVNTGTEIKVGVIDVTTGDDGQRHTPDGRAFHDSRCLYFNKPVRMYVCNYWGVNDVIPSNSAAWIEYDRIHNLIKDVESKALTVKSQIQSMLWGAKTVEKAIELWPEGAVFLEQYLTSNQTNLPTVIAEDVRGAIAELKAAA